ncbi:MAG: transcriptional regulator [Sulfuricellaceae bacterium]|nr:transcriptional regulator [Sulfuricellaceae bacterium]
MNARLNDALAHWRYVAPLLTPAMNDVEYQALVGSLDSLLDAGGADERHPLAVLASMVGELVAAYEADRYPMPEEMSGVEALAYLMDQHSLRQSDLPEIGNQAKVSEILSGKRKINARQAKAMGQRFGVVADLFL